MGAVGPLSVCRVQRHDRGMGRRNGLGEGLYGTGVLLDRAGDDVYVVQRDVGQGAGLVDLLRRAKETGVTTSLDMSCPDPSIFMR